jgi:Resolvase, N terminal domain
MRTFVRLTDAAREHDVRVVTLREGVLGGDGSPMARAFSQITAVFSELELNTAKARAKGASQARAARGDKLGAARYGFRLVKRDGITVEVPNPDQPLGPILEAYHEAGTVAGAARILNAAGVPSPRGTLWGDVTLTRVLESNDAALPAKNRAGRRRRPPKALLAQLLRCPCGRMLTPNGQRRQYYCHRGYILAGHGRYIVSQSTILPWVMEEAARLRIPGDVAAIRERDEARKTAFLAKRARWVESYAEGLIDKATRDVRLATIAREIDRLEAAEGLVDIPPAVDWTWPPERVNAVLRALWAEVTLDADLHPVAAEWIVPEWRA